MQVSILLAQKIFSMLLACFIGYLLVKVKLLKVEDSSVLSKLLAFVCAPFAIISAYQIEFSSSKAYGLLIALMLAILIHIIYIVGIRLLGDAIKLSAVERAAAIYSNAGFLVIPIVYSVLGPEWVFYTCAYMGLQAILYWTHCKSLLSGEKHIDLKKALINPNFIAIYIGIVLFVTGWRFPAPVTNTINDFSALLGPLSMVIIGLLIGNENLKSLFSGKRTYLVCFLRLVVIPLITLLVFKLISLVVYHPDLKYIMMIVLWSAAAPVGTMVAQLSQMYGTEGEYAGRLNLVSVIFCLITMPLITYIFDLIF